jgi:hypothetical protein
MRACAQNADVQKRACLALYLLMCGKLEYRVQAARRHAGGVELHVAALRTHVSPA